MSQEILDAHSSMDRGQLLPRHLTLFHQPERMPF